MYHYSNDTSNILKQTIRRLGFFIKVLMRKRSEVGRGAVWHFQFVWAAPPPSPPHLLRWPWAVWQWLVSTPWLAAKVFVCGCCLLLMRFDILAAVLSVRWPRCCSCSDILKGSSVRAAVDVCSFLLSSHLSVSLSPFLITQIKWKESDSKIIVNLQLLLLH